mmetsp:Transcript_6466/g.8916  ORF Transcript_6466/g.8916 Transcript_6466/m.8916 type:complete len:161 (+) Transcript_6466:588-1070(+)
MPDRWYQVLRVSLSAGFAMKESTAASQVSPIAKNMKVSKQPAASCARSNTNTAHRVMLPMNDSVTQNGKEQNRHMFQDLLEHHTKSPWETMMKSHKMQIKYRVARNVTMAVRSTLICFIASLNAIKPCVLSSSAASDKIVPMMAPIGNPLIAEGLQTFAL